VGGRGGLRPEESALKIYYQKFLESSFGDVWHELHAMHKFCKTALLLPIGLGSANKLWLANCITLTE